MTKNQRIIQALIKLLEDKLGRYEVGDRIFAEIRNTEVFIKGTVGQGFPDDFMKALEISTEEELYEALKSVTVNPSLGKSSPFSATFVIPQGGK